MPSRRFCYSGHKPMKWRDELIRKWLTRGSFVALAFAVCALVSIPAPQSVEAASWSDQGRAPDGELLRPVSFSVDVWTNKGGQGSGTDGGNFTVDEEIVVYFQATWDCFASIMVSPVGGPPSALMDAELRGEETYQIVPQEAGADLTGSWQVTVSGIAEGDVRASDTVTFTVGVGPSVPVSALGPDVATELDALIAYKMVLGEIVPDLSLDVDADGQVTIDDVHLILLWSVQ